jgi:hypothetical protein
MLDLKFQRHRRSRTKLGGVIEHVLAVQAAKGNRAANEALLDAVGLTLKITRNDAYGEEFSYHLALICSRMEDPESVQTYMQQSHTMPAGGGDTLFSEHVLESVRVREMQERAMAREVPSILMTAMPRSASATLALSLSQLLGTPQSRVSVGDFPDHVLVPSWLRIFLEGDRSITTILAPVNSTYASWTTSMYATYSCLSAIHARRLPLR